MKHCPHGVSQRNGGWSSDPATGWWVHGDPDCRLPSKATLDREEAPPMRIRKDGQPDRRHKPPYKNSVPEDLRLVPLPQPVQDEPGLILVAVDPGDVHCGVAFFRQDDALERGWECFWTQEYSPDGWLDVLGFLLTQNKMKTLVYERWRLYGDKAAQQTGSEFVTAQVIGIMRFLIRRQNHHARLHYEVDPSLLTCVRDGFCAEDAQPPTVELVGQMADIKKPTFAILRRKQIKSMATRQKTGGHCKDAEVHGWRWLLHGRARDIEERPSIALRPRQSEE